MTAIIAKSPFPDVAIADSALTNEVSCRLPGDRVRTAAGAAPTG